MAVWSGHGGAGRAEAALVLAVVLVFALAASGAPSSGTPYEINAILPLTGGAAFLGQAEGQTLQTLERFVNSKGGIQGRPIHIVIQDDQTSPQLEVQLAHQVLAKRVPGRIELGAPRRGAEEVEPDRLLVSRALGRDRDGGARLAASRRCDRGKKSRFLKEAS
jgi:hypothetical protein